MILEVRINNYRAYSKGVKLSLLADAHTDGPEHNVYVGLGFRALKSACVYGANNSGKSCLVKAVDSIRRVLLNNRTDISPNIFTGSNVCSLGVSFTENGKMYSYDFSYDMTMRSKFRRGFVYERFGEIVRDYEGNVTLNTIFMRNVEKGIYMFNGDDELNGIFDMFSTSNVLIYLVNVDDYPLMGECKRILRDFASKIDVLYMGLVPINKTLEVLKFNKPSKEMVVEMIKKADLEIEDFNYLNGNYGKTEIASNDRDGESNSVHAVEPVSEEDTFRLVSVHGGKTMQSISFDSDGTHRMVSLASYIVDALENGRMLFVDELDNGFGSELTKEIVALFNNEENVCAQLVFTAHDTSLVGYGSLFREDQIWLVKKREDDRELLRMSDLEPSENGSCPGDVSSAERKTSVFDRLSKPDFRSIKIPGDMSDR